LVGPKILTENRFESALIASQYDPMSIIEKIIPALAGSAQIVVHSPTSEVRFFSFMLPYIHNWRFRADPLTMPSFASERPRNHQPNDDRAFHAAVPSLARPDASWDEWDGTWRVAVIVHQSVLRRECQADYCKEETEEELDCLYLNTRQTIKVSLADRTSYATEG